MCAKLFSSPLVTREGLLSSDSDLLFNPQRYGKVLLNREQVQEAIKNHVQKDTDKDMEIITSRIEFRQISPTRFSGEFNFAIFPLGEDNKNPAIPVLPKSWILQSVKGFTPLPSADFPQHLTYQTLLSQNEITEKKINFIFDIFDSATIQLPLLPRLEIIFTDLKNNFHIQYPHKNLQHRLIPNNIYLLSDINQITLKPEAPIPPKEETTESEPIETAPESEKEFSSIKADGVYTPGIQIRFSQGQMEIFASYRFNIMHDNMRRMKHSLGELEFESLRFEPPLPFQYSADYFTFPEGISGEQTLILRARINRPGNDSDFTTPDFPELKPLPGTIYFITRENIRLEEVKSAELQQLVSLPHPPLENLDVPVLSQYSFARPADISLKTRSLISRVNNRNHVTEAELTTIITDERKIATAISMQVINPGSNGLSIELPQHSTILGSYVDSKPVRSFQNEQGLFTINLPLSEKLATGLKPLQVEIKYIEQPRQGLSEHSPINLVLPDGFPKSLKTAWNIYFPRHLRIKELNSNLSTPVKLHTLPDKSSVLQNIYGTFLNQLRGKAALSSTTIIVLLLWAGLFYGFFRILGFLFSAVSKNTQNYKSFKIILALIVAMIFIGFIVISMFSPMLTLVNSVDDEINKEGAIVPQQSWGGAGASFPTGARSRRSEREHMSLMNNMELSEMDYEAPAEEVMMQKAAPMKRSNRSEILRSDAMMYMKEEMAPAPSSLAPKVREAYKRVEKSDIKPVKVLFPRLPSELNLSRHNPMEEKPAVEITFASKRNEKHSYILILSSLFAFIIAAIITLYHKRYIIFTLICTLGVLLQLFLQPATLSADFMPYLFFPALILPLIYLKKLPVAGIILLCLSPANASFPFLQQKEMEFKALPETNPYIDVYRIYDRNKKDFVYENYYLLNKKDWENIRPEKTDEEPKTAPLTIQKQQIEINPDYHSNILKINYKLEFSAPLTKEFPLFYAPEEFQIISISADEKKGAIQRRRSRSTNILYLHAIEGVTSYEIRAELPIQPRSFDEFSASLPIAPGIINRLKNTSNEKETDIPTAVQVGTDFFFSARDAALPVIFRRHGSVKKRQIIHRNPTQTRQIRQNIDTRFIAKESRLQLIQQIRPQPPYLFFTNQFHISHKEAFSVILPENSSINEFEFSGKKLQQGIDYGIRKEKNIYYLDFPANTENVNLKISWYTKEEQLNYYLPFDPAEFPHNSMRINLLSVGERSLGLQPSGFMEQFRSGAFSSDRNSLSFENIKPTDSAAFRLSIEERKTVSFASVRCPHYYLRILLLDNIAYQEATFYLTNSGSQFLALNLPENTTIETASINNENLTPAKESPESKILLLPLKKYPDAERRFRISLLLKTQLNRKSDNEKSLNIPIPDTDVEQFFLQISSDHSNIEFSKDSLNWKNGAGKEFLRMPSYPVNSGPQIKPAINISVPAGKYQWHTKRNNLPEGLKIEYKEHKIIPEKSEKVEIFMLIEVLFGLLLFALIYRKSDSLKEQSPKLVIALIIIFGLIFFLLERTFVYFYLIMTIAWLLSLPMPSFGSNETVKSAE
jgi:hypothetical protein